MGRHRWALALGDDARELELQQRIGLVFQVVGGVRLGQIRGTFVVYGPARVGTVERQLAADDHDGTVKLR